MQADDVTKNPNIYQVGGSDYKENDTYVNVSGTQSNRVNPNSVTTAWNNGPSTPTVEAPKEQEPKPKYVFHKYIKK